MSGAAGAEAAVKGRIDSRREGRVEIITIDNQRKRNAFSGDMAEQLRQALQAANDSAEVGAIVITGAGSAFSSGHDLNDVVADRSHLWDARLNRPFELPASLDKPVIAAVNGPAYAAGLILSIHCDIRFAAPEASFCSSGARLGMVPVGGQVSRLSRLIPRGWAQRMLLGGAPIDGETAHLLGLVQELAPLGSLLERAVAEAEAIAANSALSLASIKRLFQLDFEFGPQPAVEQEAALARAAGESEDSIRRIDDFLAARGGGR